MKSGRPIGDTLVRTMTLLASLGEADGHAIRVHLDDISAETVRKALSRAEQYGLADKLPGWPAKFRPVRDWQAILAARIAPPQFDRRRASSVWELGAQA